MTTTTPDKVGEIRISDWRPYEKNSLRAFFTISLPSGLVLRKCMLHQKADARWISFASREWTNAEGLKQYDSIVEFCDRKTADRFRDSCLAAIDKHLAGEDL